MANLLTRGPLAILDDSRVGSRSLRSDPLLLEENKSRRIDLGNLIHCKIGDNVDNWNSPWPVLE